jgi:hypothetical protein
MIEPILTFVSRRHNEFAYAMGIIGQVFYIFTFETFAMIFCDKFGISGFPAVFVYIGLPIVGLVGIIAFGNGLIRSGYQNKYNKYSANINEDWVRLCNDVRELKERGN